MSSDIIGYKVRITFQQMTKGGNTFSKFFDSLIVKKNIDELDHAGELIKILFVRDEGEKIPWHKVYHPKKIIIETISVSEARGNF